MAVLVFGLVLVQAGTTTVVVDGKAVALTDAIRRSFSIPALREAVADVVYNATVKHSVDSKSLSSCSSCRGRPAMGEECSGASIA